MSTMPPPSPPPAYGQSPPAYGQDVPLDGLSHDLMAPLSKVTGWLKFLGVLSIIGGALMVLSIWGIIIAWLPIWMGVLMFQAGSRIRDGYDAKSGLLCREGTAKLAFYIKVWGITTIVVIVVEVLVLIGFLLWAVAGSY